jgi:hypothetical protein
MEISQFLWEIYAFVTQPKFLEIWEMLGVANDGPLCLRVCMSKWNSRL